MSHINLEHYFLPYCASSLDPELLREAEEEVAATGAFKNGKFSTEVNKGVVSGLSDLIKPKKHLEGVSPAEVEELLGNQKIISCNWKKDKVSLVLSDGTILHINCKRLTSKQFSATIETYFRFTEAVADVAYSEKYVIFLFMDNRLLVARKIPTNSPKEELRGTKTPATSGKKHGDDLTELRIDNYPDFLSNSAYSKKVHRKISISEDSSMLLVWWPSAKEDVFPWSPKPEQSANIHIYFLNGEGDDPSLAAYLKSEEDLILSSFLPTSKSILMLESSLQPDQHVCNIRETVYELNPMRRISETIIPLQSEMASYAYDVKKQKLALGTCDSTLVVHSRAGSVTRFVKTAFIPSLVSWHNDSQLVLILSSRGALQIFDIGLNPILLQAKLSIQPSITFQLSPPESINELCWAPTDSSPSDSLLYLRFNSGAMAILRLSVGRCRLLDLVSFHLIGDSIGAAIKVLQNVQWNSDAHLHSFYTIFGRLIICNHSEEIEKHLEYLMETFYMPGIEMKENYKKKHGKSIRIVARRYFMWLLRGGKYHRALQVAISLDEEGLFHKLKGVAAGNGDMIVASEALRRATLQRASSSSSSSEGSQYSGESSSTYSDEEGSFSTSSNSASDSGSATDGETCSCESEESIVEGEDERLNEIEQTSSYTGSSEIRRIPRAVGRKLAQADLVEDLTSQTRTLSTGASQSGQSERVPHEDDSESEVSSSKVQVIHFGQV